MLNNIANSMVFQTHVHGMTKTFTTADFVEQKNLS